MLLISRALLFILILPCFGAAVASEQETTTSTVISFLPDDVLPKSVLSEFLDKRHVGDYRVVEVDADALRTLIRDASESPTETDVPKISLPLIDQSVVSIRLRRGGESHDGWQAGFASSFGNIAGDERSTVQCVIAPDGSVNLVIRAAGKRFKLERTSLMPYHVYWVRGEGFKKRID